MTPWGDVPNAQGLCGWTCRKDSTTEAPRHRELVEITSRFLIVLGTLPCVSVDCPGPATHRHWHTMPQDVINGSSPARLKIMPTRNVVLTDHHEKIVTDLVRSGRYQNASEVLREGLRLVEAREAREATKLKSLQEAARLGFADLDEGRYRGVTDDELEAVIEALGREAAERVRDASR